MSVQQLRQAGRELGESVRYVDKGVYHVPFTLIKHSLINMDNISMVREGVLEQTEKLNLMSMMKRGVVEKF